MIPEFNENGYLPPGIHFATLDEIAERFGSENDLRQAEMESLRWLVDLGKRLAVLRIIVNGSFVTDAFEPNDVDCALLVKSDAQLNPDAVAEFAKASHSSKPRFWSKTVSISMSAFFTRVTVTSCPKV